MWMRTRPLIYSHKICLLLSDSFQGSMLDAGWECKDVLGVVACVLTWNWVWIRWQPLIYVVFLECENHFVVSHFSHVSLLFVFWHCLPDVTWDLCKLESYDSSYICLFHFVWFLHCKRFKPKIWFSTPETHPQPWTFNFFWKKNALHWLTDCVYGGQRAIFRTFHLVGCGDQTPVVRTGGNCLYSRATSPAYFRCFHLLTGELLILG